MVKCSDNFQIHGLQLPTDHSTHTFRHLPGLDDDTDESSAGEVRILSVQVLLQCDLAGVIHLHKPLGILCRWLDRVTRFYNYKAIKLRCI